jgi:hypothetical protein
MGEFAALQLPFSGTPRQRGFEVTIALKKKDVTRKTLPFLDWPLYSDIYF